MGLLLLALSGILIGGAISFRRQGKPLGPQALLGAAAVILLVLAVTTEPFAT